MAMRATRHLGFAGVLAAALLALVGTAEEASAQRKFTFAYDQPRTTAYGIAADIFDAKLKELSGSKMSIDQFPGAQLGQEPVVLQKLRSGDIDVMEQAAPQDRTTLGTDPGLSTRTVPSLGYSGIYVNVGNVNGSTKSSGAPDNVLAKYPTLRAALDLSLDRDAINKVVFDGDYTPSCTPLPTTGQWAAHLTCPSRDVAKARELVRQTGLPTPITIDLQVPNDSLDEELGTVIQSMAKDAGFAVRVDATEFTTLLANGASGKFQAQISAWSGRLDPDQDISQFYLPLSALNYSGNNDPRITTLINQGRTTVDTAARKQIYRQIAQATLAQRGIIYLFETGLTLASKKGVTGIGYFGDALIRLGNASLGGHA